MNIYAGNIQYLPKPGRKRLKQKKLMWLEKAKRYYIANKKTKKKFLLMNVFKCIEEGPRNVQNGQNRLFKGVLSVCIKKRRRKSDFPLDSSLKAEQKKFCRRKSGKEKLNSEFISLKVRGRKKYYNNVWLIIITLVARVWWKN